MTNSRVHQLLEDLMDSGRAPEEVCHAHPELLPEVRQRWQRIQLLMDEAEVVFPVKRADQINLDEFKAAHRRTPTVPGYEVLEVLGHGGMGVVFSARHQQLNRIVAIKMLRGGEHAAPRELASLVKEAQSIAQLQHPNIVQVHDVGELDGLPYFTMEFVAGGSLTQKLAGQPQAAMKSAQWVSILARAVHAAHDRGVVHRDLKPGNILIGDNGTLKIADFGLARRFTANDDTVVSSFSRVGTPSYMPPEQALGTPAAFLPTADIYALGAILYELLTGRPPFRGDSPAETERQVINDQPVPPQRLNPKTPRDLQTICLKCLQKSHQRRYPTANELADDLDRFQRGEPIHARRVSYTERTLQWVRRKPTAAALLATACVLIGLSFAAGAFHLQQRAQHRAELRGDVNMALTQAKNLRQKYHFGEATGLLRQAGQRLGPAGPDDLRQQVQQAAADLAFVEALDKARQRAAIIVGGRFNKASAEPLYVEVFAHAGLGGPQDESGAVAARVRNSPVRAEIIAALDDWASITSDPTRREWLLAIASGADQEVSDTRLRRPELWRGGPELANLKQELRIETLSPQLLTALSRVLARSDAVSALPLLRAAQATFPDDFWLNFELGSALDRSGESNEAVGFYRAALAIRPDASSAHHSLAMNLTVMKRFDEAIRHYERALAIDSTFAVAHSNFGVALQAGGRFDDAIVHYKAAARLDPDESAVALSNLGTALLAMGRVDEASERLQESVRRDPSRALAHYYLGEARGKNKKFNEAIAHLQQALQLDPNLFAARKLLADHRFNAACAAILTSVDPKFAKQAFAEQEANQSSPAALRQHALTLLRANLEWATTMPKDGTTSRAASLSAWQNDPALAAVRDPASLSKLNSAEREQWERMWADTAALIAAEPAADAFTNAARRNWAEALTSYTRMLEVRPNVNAHFWFEYAALFLLSGDDPAYAKVCARMVDLCREGKTMRAYLVARVCTLAPDAGVEASLPGRLAHAELAASSTQFWSLTQQGALHYRAHRFAQSVPLFEQSLQADARPGCAVLNWLWLAMANHKLGKSQDAHRWLDMATAFLDQFSSGLPANAEAELGLHLHNWLEAHILRREAEALIERAAHYDASEPVADTRILYFHLLEEGEDLEVDLCFGNADLGMPKGGVPLHR